MIATQTNSTGQAVERIDTPRPAMMLVPWPVVEACGDVPHRLVLRAGVVLGDPDQRGRSAPGRRRRRRTAACCVPLAPIASSGMIHDGDGVEGDQRQHAGDRQALVQRRHDVLHAGRGLDEAAADDRGDDRHAAEQQRIDHARCVAAPSPVSAPSTIVAISVTA